MLITLTTVLAAIFAAIGAIVATLQAHIANNKWKYDLFERRLKIYEASRTLVQQRNKLDLQKIYQFRDQLPYSKWLLHPRVAEYLRAELVERAISLQTVQAELHDAPRRYKADLDKERKLKEELEAQLPIIDEKFGPFLQISNWTNPFKKF